MPGEFCAADPAEDAFDQAIAERHQMGRVLGQIAIRDPHRLGEPDDACDVFGPGSTVALVPAPEQLRLQSHARAYDQAAHALRTMELVRGHREEVDAQLIDAHRDLSRRLYGVSVEVGVTVLARHGDEFADWFDGPDLIVRMHDAHQDGVRSQRLAQCTWIDQSEAVDAQSCYLEH